MITVKQLHHLHAIIKHNTIHSAARELCLTQSALTRSLNTLESTLDVTLFERSSTGMTPTHFCLQIADRCQRILLEVEELQREAAIYRNIEPGNLRIGVGALVKEQIGSEVIPEFVAQCPDVNIVLSDGDPETMIQQLESREIDLLIAGRGNYKDIAGITCEYWADIPLTIIAGSGHPLCESKNINLDDLTEFPLISATHTKESHPLHKFLLNQKKDKESPISVTSSNFSTLKAILLQGNSWTLAPENNFKNELVNGELCKLDIHVPELKVELSLMELEGRSRSKVERLFIETCQRVFSH
jgi:DNA-binding transcriptional LysR family regulator